MIQPILVYSVVGLRNNGPIIDHCLSLGSMTGGGDIPTNSTLAKDGVNWNV